MVRSTPAGWLLLVFLPRWRYTTGVITSVLLPAVLGVCYVTLFAANFSSQPDGFAAFNTLAGVKSLFQNDWLLLAGWIHYLAFDLFVQTYQPKYPKAAECLNKDKDALLTFYDFPAEQWIHLRTTNPIESTFATVRLRTAKTRGCVSRTSILSMVFKLVKSAEHRWLLLRGSELIAKVIAGIQFKNGIITKAENHQRIAA